MRLLDVACCLIRAASSVRLLGWGSLWSGLCRSLWRLGSWFCWLWRRAFLFLTFLILWHHVFQVLRRHLLFLVKVIIVIVLYWRWSRLWRLLWGGHSSLLWR